jgi:gluconokinase
MTTQPVVETIFVVGGPAGCGKTTVAAYLSEQLGAPYLEGDDVRL